MVRELLTVASSFSSSCYSTNIHHRLVLKGRDTEAIQVLSALDNTTEDDPKVQQEFRAVKDTVFEMARGSFTDCFKLNRNRNFHRTLLGYVNQTFQQVSVSAVHLTCNVVRVLINLNDRSRESTSLRITL